MIRLRRGDRLALATHNPGKARELAALLLGSGVETIGADELGLAEPEETGSTFAANAALKARLAAATADMPALADDSGLCVAALDGAPGVRSARWAGPERDFGRAMERVSRSAGPSGRAGAVDGPFHVRAGARRAGRALRRARGDRAGPHRLAAARRQGLRLRPDLPCRRRVGDLRRNGPGPQGRHEPPAAGPGPVRRRHASRGTGESRVALGIYVPLALLPFAMPVLRLSTRMSSQAWTRLGGEGPLLAALEHAAQRFDRQPVGSVFFGGGTPSLMPPATVDAILDRIELRWGYTAGPEITLEANPTSAEALKFRAYAAAGVNRISVGVQSLRDPDLRALGRTHTAREALLAVDAARRAASRVSFDLISARPGQTPAAWAAELAEALSTGVDHLSVYQLTIEPGTRFAELRDRGSLVPLDEESAADIFERTRAMTAEAGLPAYEISNHARPGEESLHNLNYWRGGGLDRRRSGRAWPAPSGAASAWRPWRRPRRLPGCRRSKPTATGSREAPRAVSASDCAEEYLMTSLRLSEGASLERYRALGGSGVHGGHLERLLNQGLLERRNGGLFRHAARTTRARRRIAALARGLNPGRRNARTRPEDHRRRHPAARQPRHSPPARRCPRADRRRPPSFVSVSAAGPCQSIGMRDSVPAPNAHPRRRPRPNPTLRAFASCWGRNGRGRGFTFEARRRRSRLEEPQRGGAKGGDPRGAAPGSGVCGPSASRRSAGPAATAKSMDQSQLFPPLPSRRFQILYADPPWDYKGQLQHAGAGSRDTGGAIRHYPTVTLDALKGLSVSAIADDASLLFLWATNPHLDQAIELGKAWGFRWATVAFVWDKVRVNPASTP